MSSRSSPARCCSATGTRCTTMSMLPRASRFGSLIACGPHAAGIHACMLPSYFTGLGFGVVGVEFTVQYRRPVLPDVAYTMWWELKAVEPRGSNWRTDWIGAIEAASSPSITATGSVLVLAAGDGGLRDRSVNGRLVGDEMADVGSGCRGRGTVRSSSRWSCAGRDRRGPVLRRRQRPPRSPSSPGCTRCGGSPGSCRWRALRVPSIEGARSTACSTRCTCPPSSRCNTSC